MELPIPNNTQAIWDRYLLFTKLTHGTAQAIGNVNAIVKNHRIELDEFFDEDEIEKTSKRVLEAEARRRLRKELEFAYQTQGYETNYDIEVWNINEWYLTKY